MKLLKLHNFVVVAQIIEGIGWITPLLQVKENLPNNGILNFLANLVRIMGIENQNPPKAEKSTTEKAYSNISKYTQTLLIEVDWAHTIKLKKAKV